ncbi:MAG: YeiH family protein, partial [Ferrovibrio sp.]|uniref:putative sulfate exporter family transporter n=1 Tax=Ferrovibrio sp. TaxID=1917215 RepID=UPI00262F82DE
AILPPSPRREQATIGAVAGVSLAGALLMLAFPSILVLLGVSPRLAGLIIGASIHDVAQAVGAGYMLGVESGDVATITKLIRVAWLAPLVLLVGIASRGEGEHRIIRPPLFLLFFLLLLGLSALGLLPPDLRRPFDNLSRFCLLAAIAAMGLRTSPLALLRYGGPSLLLVAALSLLAIVVAAAGTALVFLVEH